MIKENKEKSLPITKQMVWEAYKKVKRKRGSAGVDGINFEEFEANLSKHLYKIWNRLSSGSYFPPAVKTVAIPKKNGGERLLGIPSISDRIAQTVIKDYIEPRLEAVFSEHSYGYRPLKSAHDAVSQVRQNCFKHAWVIDLDIKGFFDNIDHELLMKAVEKHVEEKWVKMYIIRWLKAAVQTKEGKLLEGKDKGTPQGGVISPLLANLFLHYAFDKWMEINHSRTKFARYADDVIVHCETENEAKRILAAIQERMNAVKLELHALKTKIVYCKNTYRRRETEHCKFDFLGFSFQPRWILTPKSTRKLLAYIPAISKTSKKEINQQLRKLEIQNWSKLTIEEVAERLNPKIRGWINYYGKFMKSSLRKTVYKIHERLVKWAAKKYKSLNGSYRKSHKLLCKLCEIKPKLFYHWEAGYIKL